jgi:hypothetical protein
MRLKSSGCLLQEQAGIFHFSLFKPLRGRRGQRPRRKAYWHHRDQSQFHRFAERLGAQELDGDFRVK